VSRRLVRWAVVAWVGRWVALELATLLGHELPSLRRDDPRRPPGWMPRRLDAKERRR
jgi:hypothetical protein